MDNSVVDFCKNRGANIDEFKCGIWNIRHRFYNVCGTLKRTV
jgi:hypothetical protein